MSHVLDVICHTLHVTNINLQTILPKTHCEIFLETSYKIQFNGHDTNVACHMFYMSHVTHVTCHKYQVKNNFTKDPLCQIFLESSCKIKFNGHDKNFECHMLYVMCQTCCMPHMLHVTNIKLQIILQKTQCVIYFWKAHAKYS